MLLFDPDDPRPVHFVGIGGAGMSALALIARRRGVEVTGCDTDTRGAADVIVAGARVVAGHDPGHVAGVRAVVYTAAVAPTHPELETARRAGIPVIPRSEALQALVARGTVLAIAGTHGKTTTTVMATEALAAAGRNPTGIAGGRVAHWGGNARLDGDRLFVVEADEYAKSFLALRPAVAVVNNVEADHLECYGSMAALEDAFVQFAESAKRVLVGADDPGAVRVARRLKVPVWRVGTGAGSDLTIADVRQDAAGSSATLLLPGQREIRLTLRVPGLHNVRNAAMAIGAAAALEADPTAAAAALANFAGVGRRFERVGSARGVTVIDDYAHHPSEVAATLAAARQRFPTARLVAVFQPHLYSRTQSLGGDLGRALAAADLIVVTEIYAAREQPIPGVSGSSVAAAARDAGARAEWIPERSALGQAVAGLVNDGDVVLTLGAGDITEVGPELLRRLTGVAA
ncbi:MAG: UDP-N-acetylmuramate--L-alanine ligase [Gemmatimonadetes bacterium]|nr:UDP-N-acetylmuramate--L-alanine ligase [Gemmatimonadota bacterium]